MADLLVEDDQLVLRLTGAEKLEGLHGDLSVPLSSVSGIEVIDNAHAEADMHGFRQGTRLPGIIEVGTVRGRKKKIFMAVHKNTPRGVRVSLVGCSQDEWIVGCDKPEEVSSSVSSRLN
ncbi:hypothetical protein [Ferrimicrobium acidiphilum]|nr:hypothetical protein [Ferrimicrobium acidiphilum]